MKHLKIAYRALTSLCAVALSCALLMPQAAFAHCQIPCGIFDDGLRFTQLREHITTIEKSMNQINMLSEDAGENSNQLVRWVVTKEDHSDGFAEIVTAYFLQQRIKIPAQGDEAATEKYANQLQLCHQMLVFAMKCKQTTDLTNTAKLKQLVDQFEKAYLGN